MILFSGLNDWIIRNMTSEAFKERINNSGIPLAGLVYKENYDTYQNELLKNLSMQSFPMETKQWEEYGDRVKKVSRYLDYASISKLSRVNNTTLRIKKRAKANNSFIKKTKLEAKFTLFKALRFLSLEEKYVKKFEESFADLPEYSKAKEFLKEKGIKMLISCSPETPYDVLWVSAAKELHIKTYAWIRSWDNITTKIAYLPETDGVFVWSSLMEEEFKIYYPYYSTEIFRIGALQFDGHSDQSLIMKRDEFFKLTGLDPDKEFITYTTGGPRICPNEHKIVEKLAGVLDRMGLVNKPQILLRVHPYFWRTDLKLEFDNPNIIVWPPRDKIEQLKGGETKGLIDDYKVMLSTFYYQKINVNIASTVTIDSCIFDKPVINIAFDPEEGLKFEQSVARYYEYDHYKPLVESGGVRIARSPEEFHKIFLMYYKDPSIDREGRRKIVEIECGMVDGQAGGRFADKIVNLYKNIN